MSAIVDALVEARREMKMPPMNGVGHAGRNGSREYRYTLLSDLLACVVPVLLDHGILLTQSVEDGLLVTKVRKGDEELTLDSRRVNLSGTSQEQGSAETYAKRYALCTVFCISGLEDDDGQAATAGQVRQPSPRDDAAKRRMWKAVSRYADLNGMKPEDVIRKMQESGDWSESAEFFERKAREFEEACDA